LTYREPRARESNSEMNRVFLFPIIFAILPLIGFGQDPTKVAPEHAMKGAAIEREEYVSRVLRLYLGLAETPARSSRPRPRRRNWQCISLQWFAMRWKIFIADTFQTNR